MSNDKPPTDEELAALDGLIKNLSEKFKEPSAESVVPAILRRLFDEVTRLRIALASAEKERDEKGRQAALYHADMMRVREERDTARAEVERLRGAYQVLHGPCEATCATRKTGAHEGGGAPCTCRTAAMRAEARAALGKASSE